MSDSTKQRSLFNHLDLGVNIGTTGIGVDVTMPLAKRWDIRAGVSYTPSFDTPLHLGISSYAGANSSAMDIATEAFKNLTGYEIGDKVTVNGKLKMLNFKLLVDFYPLRNNRKWHLTAGIFVGPSKVATAINDMDEMTKLVSVGLFNSMYDYFANEKYWDVPIYGSVYLDPEMCGEIADKMAKVGELGAGMGTFTKTMYYNPTTHQYSSEAPAAGTEGYVVYNPGDRYFMKPSKDNATMSTDAFVNVVRPYFGIGFNSPIGKSKKFNMGFDLGAMFWGGAPDLITHEGVDLIRDVEGVSGKVGDYISVVDAFKVYPVLNFKVSYNIY